MDFTGGNRKGRARQYVDAMASSLQSLVRFGPVAAGRRNIAESYVANRLLHREFVRRLDEVVSLGLLAEMEAGAMPADAQREKLLVDLAQLHASLLETSARMLSEQLRSWESFVEAGFSPPYGAYEELTRTGGVLAHVEAGLVRSTHNLPPATATSLALARQSVATLMAQAPRLQVWERAA